MSVIETDPTPALSVRANRAAELLGVSPCTLRNWRTAGTGPRYARINANQVLYRISDLDEWLQSHLVGGGA